MLIDATKGFELKENSEVNTNDEEKLIKISVITAVYNRKETISRALLSIKKQSYSNIEVIVVDGNSSDGTQDIVRSVLGSDDCFITEPDEGIYDALNKGIQAATGDVICFLHSDDFYESENSLLTIAQVFKNDVDVDVVYGDVSFFSQNNTNRVVRVYRSTKLTKGNLSWGKMPAHPAIFIRKDVYSVLGLFKTHYQIAADYEFLCRMMTSMSIKSVYVRGVIVRMQVGGISTSGLRSTILLNKEVLRACQDNGLKTNILMLLSKYPSNLLQLLRK